MAFLCKMTRAFGSVREIQVKRRSLLVTATQARALSTTTRDDNTEQGWLSKLLMVRKIEPGKDSHSRLLSDSEAVYEMQIHDVKPDSVDAYLKSYQYFVEEAQSKDPNFELMASWRVDVGDQDQIVNIWRHKKGYPLASKTQKLLRTDSDLKKIITDQSKMVRQRQTQMMMAFSFWGHPQPAIRDCNYEMRSYVLKPGTMIEWGNNWARGINYRNNKVGAFFSQIGQLYMVHHIWHYDDLQNRKDVREDAWRKPGWDEIVAYTVPLIREMRSRWMTGNDFSPIR
ncbi:Protein NipSnap [Halotydeus destructor]|nr:Protein NipSnap [Halotydeus destructor]